MASPENRHSSHSPNGNFIPQPFSTIPITQFYPPYNPMPQLPLATPEDSDVDSSSSVQSTRVRVILIKIFRSLFILNFSFLYFYYTSIRVSLVFVLIFKNDYFFLINYLFRIIKEAM